jgi:hypothetical protein
MDRKQYLQVGTLVAQTRGGQLSKSTQWVLSADGATVCEIERVNWKWKWWTYRASIRLDDEVLEATSEISRDALTIHVRDGRGEVVATATDRTTLLYRDQQWKLAGIESPDTVVDSAGHPWLGLFWHLERLHHVDLMVPASAEFVAIATTACLLHERPTN